MTLDERLEAGPREPAVRGFATHLHQLPPNDRAAVRATLDDGDWRAIDDTSIFGWLPIAVNVRVTCAIGRLLGPERTHEFFRSLLLTTAQTPLVHALVQAALRIAVPDPGLYVAWLGRGYELMFRDAGRWEVVERQAGLVRTKILGLPEQCVAEPLWLQSLASSTSALLTLVDHEGAIEIEDVDVGRRSVHFRGHYKKR